MTAEIVVDLARYKGVEPALAWFRAHGVDPSTVLPIALTLHPDGRATFYQYLVDPEGNRFPATDGAGMTHAAHEEVTIETTLPFPIEP